MRIQAGYGVDGSLMVSFAAGGTQVVRDGTFAAVVTYAAGDATSSVTTGHLNGDGKLDLITANYLTDALTCIPHTRT